MLHNDLETIFGFLLTDVTRMYRAALDKSVISRGLSLTPGEIRTLVHIARYEGVRQAVLAERMGIEPMTVSAYIDRLEAYGLVTRQTDPRDRRAKLVSVTAKADQVFEEVRPIISATHEMMMDGIAQEDRDLLVSMLIEMRARLTSTPAPVIPLVKVA
ncbi:MarR family winged helix-turn-helix transcriptional regulator [Consotaella salsifontis]|uniref:DNA-binding transcriptional regulator, MarR family n=1 Tax=Consotaella salsifontis TaxID=1365950 RepID=A0A1T4SM41_9HYPH|nr:MarR family transcriptional regulator [Consotaella salsifontis]SKA29364.1 DNA-binding transcriptional regulator, MarR family [Consotaella salsifontis]